MNLKSFLETKNLVVNTLYINQALKLNLSLSEFSILIYFDNLINKVFDIKQLTLVLKINESDALTAFNQLIDKKLITIVAEKNNFGKIIEKVNLDAFYSLVSDDIKNNNVNKKKEDIFTIFEKEFGRPISSMEYEIINAWLDKSYSEEMILGALKEAIYNGVTNLRYIDKILYEWQRKGFKNMSDVESHLKKRKKKDDEKVDELFDYNWLDDDN